MKDSGRDATGRERTWAVGRLRSPVCALRAVFDTISLTATNYAVRWSGAKGAPHRTGGGAPIPFDSEASGQIQIAVTRRWSLRPPGLNSEHVEITRLRFTEQNRPRLSDRRFSWRESNIRVFAT